MAKSPEEMSGPEIVDEFRKLLTEVRALRQTLADTRSEMREIERKAEGARGAADMALKAAKK